MKVKNNTKAVLVLKAVNGSQLSIKPSGSHTFKKEELGLFSKMVANYMKSGWLSEDKSKGEDKVVEAPKEVTPEPVVEAPKTKPAKKAKKTRKRT